jgi:serine O-acetyltransferase
MRFMFAQIKEDIDTILQRDPAARSRWEALTCYPGLHALILHRRAHWCWTHGFKWTGRFISHISRAMTGIEVHPGAVIGRRVFIDHGMGIVVGETVEIGDDCTIYQGVTLGGTSLSKGAKRHPTLGKGVIISAGAKVLGSFTVGDGARVGSNAVLLQPVPPGATAVGIPARIITNGDKKHDANVQHAFQAYGITAGDDPVSKAINQLTDHVEAQEKQIAQLYALLKKQGVPCDEPAQPEPIKHLEN